MNLFERNAYRAMEWEVENKKCLSRLLCFPYLVHRFDNLICVEGDLTYSQVLLLCFGSDLALSFRLQDVANV